MDRLTAMEVFTRVVERSSFTLAAEELRLSRAMVSKHVQDLEERLGVRLLNRTTRRVSVTEAGRHYFERCAQILAEVEAAENAAGEHQIEPRGLLRLNAPMSFGIRHLGPAIAEFSRIYNGVAVDMVLNDRVVDLIDEGYDLAVRIGRLADSSLIGRRLAPCRLVVCAAPEYLAERGKPVHPDDLGAHNCLDYTYAALRNEWRFLKGQEEVSVRISGNLMANNGDVLRAAALCGQGIVMQPTFLVGDDLNTGRLVPLLTEYRLPELGIFALYPPGRVSAKVRSFVSFLASLYGDAPDWDRWADCL